MTRLSKWSRRRIVAWDGEGANLDSGEHVYNLLANSNKRHILNHEGLSTKQCFDFMFQNNDQLAINVIFGGSYDVNMILRDVPLEELAQLWSTGSTIWEGYRIHYRPRKLFSIARATHHRLSNGKMGWRAEPFTLWDVFGFYQASFVAACRKWLGSFELLDEIEAMKYQRSTFKVENVKEIINYNATECRLLVTLVEALLDSLEEADIRLSRFDGAGAIAAALLGKYHVKDHKGQVPIEVNRLAQRAYSGGRIEACKVGNLEEGKVYRYDINSAYPTSILELPSYRDCRWGPATDNEILDNDLVAVEWNIKTPAPFYPLWYREPNGNIVYPSEGTGVYWGVEIRNLIEHYRAGVDYELLSVWRPTLSTSYHPFSFVGENYDKRLEFKRRGSMAQESLKLGLNSLYGKMVQQEGYRNGHIPIYHQLLWGSYVTADTRAKMYRLGMQAPDAIIGFATDAVFSLVPLEVPEGVHLGEWTAEEFDGMTIVQAGVYWLRQGAEWQAKYRGFDKGALDREAIVRCWRNGETKYPARLTRFVGLGGALNTTDFYNHWRRWESMDRNLDIQPTGKRTIGPETCFGDQLCATLPGEVVNPAMLSTPYPIVWLDGTKPLIPIDEQSGLSVRVLEAEEEDSYA